MKKILLIVIIALAITSVFIVGLFAPQADISFGAVKVTDVKFDHSDEKEVNDELMIVLASDSYTYTLKWIVYPEADENGYNAATNQTVSFTSSNSLVIVSDSGVVTFPEESSTSIKTTITIVTEDGDKTDTIVISKEYSAHSNW